ncbi:hypothetical protein C8R46DRAFT_1091609 [Mycena filopes]|nr:hypothetical protein C8R46DRAFT_1091609 [Mycena filopes]
MEAESSTRPARRPRTTATKKRKSDADEAGPAPKRTRTSKKGRLAGLLDISLDVVFEIFGNLQPLDLLRLSRTSKEFRNLLIHRSSITVWRSSLSNVPGLPPCPPGMNEPQWISLVFDATCQVCQKIARKVDWPLYIRICGKCVKTHISTRFYGITQKDEEGVNFKDLIPVRPDLTKPFKTVYFSKALEDVKAAYERIDDAGEKSKFIEERKERVKVLKEHAKLCEVWSESVAENRTTELADLKEERYNAVHAKLTALGWGSELDNILPADSLRNHKAVKQPHALTERTWKTIQPEMVRYMEQMKVKRLAREHVAIVLARKKIAGKVLRTFKRSQLPWTDVMPGPADFYEFPKIKDILTQPSEAVVEEQTFEVLLSEFPGMFATWREGLTDQVMKVYRVQRGLDIDDNESIKTELTLAVSVFKCGHCSDSSGWTMFTEPQKQCYPLYWPKLLAHRCLTRQQGMDLVLMYLTNGISNGIPNVSGTVEKIVEACGMDPETTTVEQMDAADVRLACHRCTQRDESAQETSVTMSKSEGKQKATEDNAEQAAATTKAYTWRNAVRHDVITHCNSPTAWHMLTEAEAAAARALEAVAIQKNKIDPADDEDYDSSDSGMLDAPLPPASTVTMLDVKVESNADEKKMSEMAAEVEAPAHPGMVPSQLPELAWSCAHCLDQTDDLKSPVSLEAMMLHLAGRHDVLGSPRLNEDYYRALAVPEVYSKTQFPAPSVRAMMPSAPEYPKAPTLSRGYPYYDYEYGGFGEDSDDEGMGMYDSDDPYGFW